ncbi:coiled-coil domain-containing protein 172 [Chiloscyllium plagiosum]|uniref:coiled-coil domain-containing protein 172 n=1 Tax=Chiloscyllium plagiosum TaxID=36176 RepID=UPI001CB80F00|nr:coiled-coil domain-containing protein 172 [Chiloscyllium plagiosum]
MKNLSEELFHWNLLKKQEETLTKQREEMTKENNLLYETLEEKKKKIVEEREKFVQEISEFNTEYDLLSNRIITIESKAKSKVFDLDTEATHLKNEMKCLEQKNVHLNALEKQKNELKEEIHQLQRKFQGIEDELTTVIFNTKALEEEKVKICQKPQTDPEFLRLKKELELHKEGDLESFCEALRAEIQYLQMVTDRNSKKRLSPLLPDAVVKGMSVISLEEPVEWLLKEIIVSTLIKAFKNDEGKKKDHIIPALMEDG